MEHNLAEVIILLSTNGRVQVILYATLKDGEQCNSMSNNSLVIVIVCHGVNTIKL